jgi:hypothetical protein
MIWQPTGEGVYDCGYYRIRRCIKFYELWWNHPQNLHLLAKARFLAEIKSDAEQHRAKHPL